MDVQAFVAFVGGWLATTNGIVSALVACVTGLGTLMTTLYAMFQSRKLSIDKVFGRESHNLRLFQALADPNPQLQLAAAAVLVERLKRLNTHEGRSDDDPHERAAIVRALISVTKVGVDGNAGAEPKTPAMPTLGIRMVPVEVGKFVADSVAEVLGARDEDAKARKDMRHKRDTSPLKPYDWQWAKLRYVWWPAIDARGVDFFNADISHAGLRFGNFQDAQLREVNFSKSTVKAADFTNASLVRAVFAGARLQGSIFLGADLQDTTFDGADLSGADLRGAKNFASASFAGAFFDSKTLFPDDAAFASKRAEMVPVEVMMR